MSKVAFCLVLACIALDIEVVQAFDFVRDALEGGTELDVDV